ncbi:1032_t:CDS:2 [Racocetra persica]|uniref:1032_t:CDS:1 n=1 Tax=Racocetra persica TaxID=160502 RepID=A0ACA9M5G1_9GLOM|nr:1032_t:CDS:2 [Racocetra persica]
MTSSDTAEIDMKLIFDQPPLMKMILLQDSIVLPPLLTSIHLTNSNVTEFNSSDASSDNDAPCIMRSSKFPTQLTVTSPNAIEVESSETNNDINALELSAEINNDINASELSTITPRAIKSSKSSKIQTRLSTSSNAIEIDRSEANNNNNTLELSTITTRTIRSSRASRVTTRSSASSDKIEVDKHISTQSSDLPLSQ